MLSEHDIGISTVGFRDVTVEEAVLAVLEAGFGVFELYLCTAANRPTLWPRTCDRQARKKLKALFAEFRKVAIHMDLLDVNINSLNPGFRDEVQRQYRECLEFALDVGASVVTFLPGTLSAFRDGVDEHFEETFQRNAEFARELADAADGADVRLGYEITNLKARAEYFFGFEGFNVNWLDYYARLVREIDHPRFGLSLDVPLVVVNSEDKTAGELVAKMDAFGDKLVNVHAHGLYAEIAAFKANFDLRRNNRIDYAAVFSSLRSIDYHGPVVLRIAMKDIPATIAKCREFRDFILRLEA